MSWEIFVQVWLYSVIGFVVGVLLTWLVWVRPLQRRLPKQEPVRAGGTSARQAMMAQPQAPAQQQAPAQPPVQHQATPLVTAPRTTPGVTASRAAPQQPGGTLFAPPQRPVPEETPEEQTLVFDFGGPNSTSQTRKVDEPDDAEPWRPMLDFDPNDRLSAQLPKREREAVPEAEPDSTGQPGMFEAVVPADGEVPSPPEPTRSEPVEDSAWRPAQDQPSQRGSSSAEYFSFLERTGELEVEQPAATSWELNGDPEPEEPKQPEGTEQEAEPLGVSGGLPRRVPGASGIPNRAAPSVPNPEAPTTSSAGTLSNSGTVEPDPLRAASVDTSARETGAGQTTTEPPAEVAPASDPVAPAALPVSSGSLFDPDHEPPATTGTAEKRPPMGPFGPGSALPLPDGSAPASDFTVKARTSSMVFHTKESPFFDRLLPQVWFSDETVAARAGFTSWERPSEG